MEGDIEYLYRKDPNYDRSLDDIDWAELLFDEPDEFDPQLHAYDSRNYATEEEASAALRKLFDDCLQEALRAAASARQHDERATAATEWLGQISPMSLKSEVASAASNARQLRILNCLLRLARAGRA